MRKRARRLEPLSCVEMLQAASKLRRVETRDGAGRWVVDHRAQLKEHAAGAPCRYGHDPRAIARRLLDWDANRVMVRRNTIGDDDG